MEPDSDLQRYALLEVYAPDGSLLKSIEDENIISQYIQFSSRDINVESIEKMDELAAALSEYEPAFYIVSYRIPAAQYSFGTLERMTMITVYEGINIVKEEIDPGVIKNGFGMALTPNYYEISDEAIKFYVALAD